MVSTRPLSIVKMDPVVGCDRLDVQVRKELESGAITEEPFVRRCWI